MNILKPIEKITKFSFFKNTIVLLNTNYDLLLENNTVNKNVKDFVVFNNILYLQLNDQLTIYDEYLLEHILIGKYFLSNCWLTEDGIIILTEQKIDDKYFLIKKNFSVCQVSWHNSFIKYCSKYSFISIFKNNFSYHNLTTGETIWQKDFTHDIAKIEVWNEKVVVIELYDAHTIIALSSDDGQLLWEQSGWLLHVHNNAIYMIYNPDPNILIVKKTDAVSGSVINYDLSEILQQNQLLGEAMQYTVVDNLIYFSFFYKKIVTIINLETLQLQWFHQIQTDASWIKEPRVEGNRLYVLDSNQTLHIFEKEE